MNCEDANNIDMVDYLASLGFEPKKIRGQNYWYLSPLRNEKEPSFKIERNKNVWYDHGEGKGGKLVGFVAAYYKCSVSDALQKIAPVRLQSFSKTHVKGKPLFHLQSHYLLPHKDAKETAIKIIAAKQPVQDLILCLYLKQRRIEKHVSDKYVHEVDFTNGEKQKIYKAIGFKNDEGGYELRNEYFQGSSSPKAVTYLNNKENALTVFEGFFDFMAYQSLHQKKSEELPEHPTNFLVLNSLSFFERSMELMEKHKSVHLYLDNDNAGKKYMAIAQKKSSVYKNESSLYRGYKDLNEWKMNFGKFRKQKAVGLHRHL